MNLVDRAKNILMKPKDEWQVIGSEEPVTQEIVVGYMLPMAAIPFVGTLIGTGLLGPLGIAIGIGMGIAGYISSILGTFLIALVVNALATSFGSEKNFGRSLQLVVYGTTAQWVGGFFNIIPFVGWLVSLAGWVYSIYTLYLGFPDTMKTPQDKIVIYMIVTVLVMIGLYFLLITILSAIILAILAVFGFGAASMFSL